MRLRQLHFILALFVLLDWGRARLGGAPSNQRVVARKPPDSATGAS